jgi:hypothetical protein
MASPSEQVLESQLGAENALRRAKIDRMIKAKIDDDALELQASKDNRITSPLAAVSNVSRTHSSQT